MEASETWVVRERHDQVPVRAVEHPEARPSKILDLDGSDELEHEDQPGIDAQHDGPLEVADAYLADPLLQPLAMSRQVVVLPAAAEAATRPPLTRFERSSQPEQVESASDSTAYPWELLIARRRASSRSIP